MRYAFLLIAALMVAGCAQPQQGTTSTTTQGVKEFRVEISHFDYKPASFTVNKGDTVRFLAVAAAGTGSHNHGITIDEFGINVAVKTEDPSNPVKIEFVADKTGTFKIWCKTCWDGPFGTSHPPIQATLVVK